MINRFIFECFLYHVISSGVTQGELAAAVDPLRESIDLLSSTVASLKPTLQALIDELAPQVDANGKLIEDIQAQQEGLYDLI